MQVTDEGLEQKLKESYWEDRICRSFMSILGDRGYKIKHGKRCIGYCWTNVYTIYGRVPLLFGLTYRKKIFEICLSPSNLDDKGIFDFVPDGWYPHYETKNRAVEIVVYSSCFDYIKNVVLEWLKGLSVVRVNIRRVGVR